MIYILSALVLASQLGCSEPNSPKQNLPEGFVFITDIDPTIKESVRYSTKDNFLGRVVSGYQSNRVVSTKVAADALKRVHDDLKKEGYNLVVYDGYRPQRAVDSFVLWAKDINDATAKANYYPDVNKQDLFKLNYIAEKSSHTRGSTFDLTLIKRNEQLGAIKAGFRQLTSGEKIPYLDDNTVDMGSSFDLFHKASHHDSSLVTAEQSKMRNLLRSTMKKHGFKEYKEEWWHYTLENEPYPDTYFDFVVGEQS